MTLRPSQVPTVPTDRIQSTGSIRYQTDANSAERQQPDSQTARQPAGHMDADSLTVHRGAFYVQHRQLELTFSSRHRDSLFVLI